VVSDRQGKIWVEINPDATPNAPSAFPVCMALDNGDFAGNPGTSASPTSSHGSKASTGPQITERYFPEIAYVEYGGIVYDHNSGASTAILAGGPGVAPSYKGDIDHMEGMILTSQTQLNQIVGASYAYQNSRFPEIAVGIVGGYKNIDIAPLETIYITIPEDSTPRYIK
jgi:hypothetical protein